MAEEPLVQARCRGCGKKIIFAIDDAGRTQVLDPAPPVFHFFTDAAGRVRCVRQDALKHAVTHFATCPKASEFSGRRRG